MTSERLPLDALDLGPEDVRARMREARERGQPFFPWADLAPEAWRASLAAIERVVSERLRQEGDGEDGSAPVRLQAPAGARALGIAAFTSGTGPLLGRWIERGGVACEPEAARLLLLHLDHGRRRSAHLEQELARVIDALDRRGVVPTVVKGAHTAHAYFPEPGTRPMSDLDLVVAPEDIAEASRALAAEGFASRPVLRRPYMAEWLPPDAIRVPRSLDLTHEGNPWSVDLHATFKRDFGGVRTISVVPPGSAAAGPFRIAGRDVHALVGPYLAAYLSAHASQELKNLTLVRLVELVWVLRRGAAEGTLDWTELWNLLARQRAGPYVYPALELAERLSPGTLPGDFRLALEGSAPARVRQVIERLTPGTAQRLEQVSLEEQFMWAAGPLDHLRRLRRILWPSWAGSVPEAFGVQTARLRQLVKRRVVRRGRGRARGT